jgi:hypothetical protein
VNRGEQWYNWELREGDVIRVQPSGRLVRVLRDVKWDGHRENVVVKVRTIDMPLGEWVEVLPAGRRHKVFWHGKVS